MSRIEPGQIFSSWTLIKIEEPLGKRATCRCTCGNVRQVSLEALETGVSTSCGCAGEFRSGGRPQAGQASFARHASVAEAIVARKRHQGRV